MKKIHTLFFAVYFLPIFSQDYLTIATSNNLIYKEYIKSRLQARGGNDSANYIIEYDPVDLPFSDEFSTNLQRPPNNLLPPATSEYFVVGKCTEILNYKRATYGFSKNVSTEDTYNPAFPPDYIQTGNLSPILYSLNDSPNCTNLSLLSIYPPTIKRKFSATGTLLWDSLIYDTTIYAARIRTFFIKGYLWADRQAYINTHLPYNPPSKGVATLDGIDEFGSPYNKSVTNAYGPADKLTSVPINLQGRTGSDSIYLSFLIQPQGLGDYPDVQDSIMVEFLDDKGRWNIVWTQKGLKQELAKDSMFFKFASIHVPDPIVPSDPFYFHDIFQFRFRNFATISGNNDHWHIDYVRLDDNRNYLDTAILDANFSYELPSVLKFFTHLPAKQYRGKEDLEDSICIRNRNIYPAPIFSSYKFRCYNENTGNVYGSISAGIPFPADPVVVHCLQTGSQLNFPLVVGDSTYVKSQIFFDNADDFKTNDSATNQQFFFNEMAYDDGSAEWAYGVQGLGTKKMAYRFFIPNKDTLAAIKIMFSNIDVPVSNLVFNLVIWKTIGINGQTEQILKTISNVKPVYRDSLNGYVTLALDQSIEVQDTIYVGWIQTDERNLQVGYDVNSSKGYDNIFILTNNVWSKTNIAKSRAGSPMIRLILDGVRKFSTNQVLEPKNNSDNQKINFYPNPANQALNIDFGHQQNIAITIFDLVGKQVLKQNLIDSVLDVSSLEQGMYILQFSIDGVPFYIDKLHIVR